MSNLQAGSLAGSYAAGRARVCKLNADNERVAFLRRLVNEGERAGIVLTAIESDFVLRVLGENRNTPDLHPGDANICDWLQRKFQACLDINGGLNA